MSLNVILISTYELGHQPFGIASPAAWLKKDGASVQCMDLSLHTLEEQPVTQAELIAFYLPMHTATRMAIKVLPKVKRLNPDAHLCFYGLYAPVNEEYLRKLGANTILGGEFEEGLVSLAKRLSTGSENGSNGLQTEPVTSLAKQKFVVPDRTGLPDLSRYAHLSIDQEKRIVGYTEASRGCKHLCRHCPIVPVYNGRFRVVQHDIVLEDIKTQVNNGATHITFGDPDFFNGPRHAIRIVQALKEAFPGITYDVIIKIEHLLKQAELLPELRDTGCLFVTSAVESIDDSILEYLDKRHTRQDLIDVVNLFEEVGLCLQPTFVTFTPWTTLKGYLELVELIETLDLVDNVSPVQYAIRLLIPYGSKMLDLAFIRELVESYDESALFYPWSHPDPNVDHLYEEVRNIVSKEQSNGSSRRAIFAEVWKQAHVACGIEPDQSKYMALRNTQPAKSIPSLSEPWYCCAEPTDEQMSSLI